MAATKNGHEDIVQYLVDHGFDPHYQKEVYVNTIKPVADLEGGGDNYYCTSAYRIVQMLLVYTIFSNECFFPQDGVTALHIASYKGYKNIIRYLCLTKRLVVDIKDIVSFTSCLHYSDFIIISSVYTLRMESLL